MRTTLDLPEELLNEAMSLTGEKTKTAVIIRALKTEIQKAKLVELLKLRGKYPDFALDLDVSRGRTRAQRLDDLMRGITDDFDTDLGSNGEGNGGSNHGGNTGKASDENSDENDPQEPPKE